MKRFEGKLFGAALGFSFAGPIGALIGTALGHLYDSSASEKKVMHTGAAQKELAFITSLILLLTGTARADGRVSTAELEEIKNFFRYQLGYGAAEFLIIERIINKSFQKEVNLPEACAAITRRTSYEERLFLVRLNYQVAVSDGALNRIEEEYIKQASGYLGINDYDYSIVRNTFASYRKSASSGSAPGPVGAVSPYTLLGLAADCTDDDVHRAYRSLANKYHPDKVSHLGKEFIDLATDRFNRIGEAYESIKKERGLS